MKRALMVALLLGSTSPAWAVAKLQKVKVYHLDPVRHEATLAVTYVSASKKELKLIGAKSALPVRESVEISPGVYEEVEMWGTRYEPIPYVFSQTRFLLPPSSLDESSAKKTVYIRFRVEALEGASETRWPCVILSFGGSLVSTRLLVEDLGL